MTKAEFVRAHPEMGPKELVALAAEHDIVFTPGYVSQIRYQDGRKAAKGDGAPKRKRVAKPKQADVAEVVPMFIADNSTTLEFRRLVTRIGTDQAKAIMAELEA